MTQLRHVTTLSILAVILLAGYSTSSGDTCCSLEMERFDDTSLTPQWGVGNTVVRAQSFTPHQQYTLCGVGLYMTGSGGATLYIQDDPTSDPTTIYAQGNGSSSATVDHWVFFDTEPDIQTSPGEMLFIRITGGVNPLWRKYEDQSVPHWDAYPYGQAFEDGMACDDYDPDGDYHDFYFITYTWEECQQPTGIRIYLDADPNNHIHEIHPNPSETFDAYVCLDCFGEGEGTRGTAFLIERTFTGFKLAQNALLGGLDFGDAEVDGWTIAAGADCVYPDADGVVCVGVLTYLYMAGPGWLRLHPHDGTGREVLDCDFGSGYWCVHANLGVSMPPPPGDPGCECEPSLVLNKSWGAIKSLFR